MSEKRPQRSYLESHSTHRCRRLQPQNTQDIDIPLKHLSSSFPGSLPILPSVITHCYVGKRLSQVDGTLTGPGHSAAPAQKQAPSPTVYQWAKHSLFKGVELNPHL